MRQNKLFLFLLSVFFAGGITAQTSATALPYSTGFEDATNNASWQFANATTNQWAIGAATNNGGTNALYISSDGGTSNAYIMNGGQTSFAYRAFHFEKGDYVISFDWKCNGESGYDFMQVVLTPASITIKDGTYDGTLGSITRFGKGTTDLAIEQAGFIRANCSNPYNETYPYCFHKQTTWAGETFGVSIDTEGDYYLVFSWHNDGSSGDNPPAAVDNIAVSKKVCGDVKNLTVSALTSSSVTLTWDAVDGGVRYEYAAVLAGASLDETKLSNTTSATATINNLSANTEYTAYVRSVCSEGAGTWTRLTFRTDCAAQTVPFAEGFEGEMPEGNYVIPYCWNRIAYSNYPYVYEPDYSTDAHDGAKSLIFTGGSSISQNYAVLPVFSVPVNGLMLSFYYKNGYVQDGYGKFIAGVMSDPADPTTFVAIDTLEQEDSWTLARVYLNAAPATHNYIAIKYGCADRSYGNSYIDDITVENLPACIPVKDLKVAETGKTTATVTWKAGKDETAWIAKYVKAGETDTVTLNVSATPSFTISGLEHSTAYTYIVSVQSDCGSDKAEAITKRLSFATECDVLTAVAHDSIKINMDKYKDNTEFDEILCWNTFAGKGTTGYKWKTTAGKDYVVSGTTAATVSGKPGANTSVVLATPQLRIADGSEVSFYVKATYANSNQDSIVVWVNNDQSLNGAIRLGVVTDITGEWQRVRFSLPVRGDYVILLESYNQAITPIVDDILVSIEPACLPPTKLVLGDVSARQATFSWKPGKNETEWAVVAENKSGEHYFEETVSGTPAFTMIDLEPATTDTFDITIRSVCDGVESAEALTGQLIFTTICEPADHTATAAGDTLLFTSFEANDENESFDTGWDGNAHICWTNTRTDDNKGDDDLIWRVKAGSSYAVQSGRQYLYLKEPGSSRKPGMVLALPAMSFNAGQEIGLDFYAMTSGDATSTLADSIIVYINSTPSLEGATRIGSTGMIATDYTHYAFDPIQTLDGANYVILYTERPINGELRLDDITLRMMPVCRKVKEAAVTDITTTSAKLAWTPAHEENTWNVVVKNGKDVLVNRQVTTPSVVLEDLTPATKYTLDVTIAAVCDNVEAAEKFDGQLVFVTECDVITAETWVEDFETMDAVGSTVTEGPRCWNILDANTVDKEQVYVTASSPACHSGSRGMTMVLGNRRTDVYALLPEMENIAGKQLIFWYKMDYTYYTKALEVGYLTDANDKATWKVIASYTPSASNQWNEVKVVLECPEDVTDPHFGFRYHSTQSPSSTCNAYIDDIKVRPVPVCDMATDLHVIDSLSTANSATVAWSGLADAGYTVIFRGNDTITKQVADTFCVLDGLSASRIYNYEVSVVARCAAGEAVDTLTTNLQWLTDCAGAVTTFPYNVGFEEEEGYAYESSTVYTMPKCVVSAIVDGASSGGRLIPSNANSIGVHSGSQYLYLYGAHSSSYYYRSSFAFSEMVIPEAEAYELAIWSRINSNNNPSYPDSVEVFYNTEKQSLDGATKIGAFKPTTTYTQYKFTLPAAGSQYVVLKAWANQGQIFFDDASFRKIPSCFPVENVRVSATGLDTARVAWDTKNDGASYRVTVQQGENTLYSGMVNDTVLVLRNLTPSSMYDNLAVTIVTVCTDGEESADIYTGTISFATECGTITDFPWVEDFEGYDNGTFSHPCWLNEHVSGPGNKPFAIYSSSSQTRYLQLPDQNETTYTRLVLPAMDIPKAGAYDFYLDVSRMSGTNKPTEGVYIIVGTDTLAFIPRQITGNGINVPTETTAAWYTYHFTIPNAGVQNITILGRSEWGSATNMDNFMVKANGKVPSALSGTGADSDMAIKFVRNGQVYILRNGVIYNALGQRIEMLK